MNFILDCIGIGELDVIQSNFRKNPSGPAQK